MVITRLYTNAAGVSALEEVRFPLERAGVEQFTKLLPPTEAVFTQTDVGHEYDWHNAPKRQWVITLQGEIEVRLRNGESKRFGAGSVILAEDLTGSGHATSVVGGVPWCCVYLPIDGGY